MADDTTDAGILYIRGLPADLKAHFKAFCAKRGVSMTAKIVELMRETIKETSTKTHGQSRQLSNG